MIKCKLLGIDLDGTLLSTFKHISRTDMKSLKEYQALGGNFVLCTGRSINSTFNYSRLIDDKMNTVQKFIIACCGSYIMNLTNSTVKEYFIPDAVVRKIHNYVLTTSGKIALWAYTKESIDTNSVLVTKHVFNNIVKIFKSSKLVPLVETIEDLSSYKLNVLGVNPTRLKTAYDWLVANVGNDVDLSYSHRRLIEITPKGVNKKTALEYVAKQLKIPQTQVAYVGDSNNDAPALKWAPLSIAIGPNKKLIEVAKYHIRNRKNCVTTAINKYVKDEALQISLVASDLDGTLFDKNTTIVPSTLHLIKRFINEKNGFFAIASGRNLADVLLVLDEIETNKTDNLFAITCNGAAVYDIANKKCIFSKTIDSPVVKEIIDLFSNMFANKQDKFLEVYAHYEENMIFNRQPLNSYVINREEQFNFYKKYSPQIIERYWAPRNAQPLTDEVIANEKILKILVTVQNQDERARMIAALDKFKDRVTICSSSGFNIEINALHVSKGSALEILCHYLSIDPKTTIAVGDNFNDIPMLELSPYSATMLATHEKVKKAAHYVFDVPSGEIVGTAIEKIAFNKNNE